jgi:hypothetical protein
VTNLVVEDVWTPSKVVKFIGRIYCLFITSSVADAPKMLSMEGALPVVT